MFFKDLHQHSQYSLFDKILEASIGWPRLSWNRKSRLNLLVIFRKPEGHYYCS